MDCNHDKAWRCILCAPELWHPPQEETDKTNRRIYQEIVENLIKWNKAYREDEAIVSDYKYDSYELSLKKAYPDHPILVMVGHDESKIQEILDYIPAGRNPIL